MSRIRDTGKKSKGLKARAAPSAPVERNGLSSPLESLGYTITEEAISDDAFDKLPNAIQDRINDLCGEVQVAPRVAIKELTALIRKFPDVNQLYNYLYNAYGYAGREAEALRVLKVHYQKSPSYLFAKINYADYLARRGRMDKVEEMLDNHFDLADLYPSRRVFHVSEVIGFNGVIGYYHALKGENEKARRCLDILQALSPQHGLTERLSQKLDNQGQLLA